MSSTVPIRFGKASDRPPELQKLVRRCLGLADTEFTGKILIHWIKGRPKKVERTVCEELVDHEGKDPVT